MVFYPTDTGVFLLNLVMPIGSCNILAAECSNFVPALLLAGKYTDSLMWKDGPWPLHLAILNLQAAHLLFLFLIIIVSCSFSGTTVQIAYFHLSTSLPLALVFGQVQTSLCSLVVPSATSSPCPQAPCPPLPWSSFSLAWPLQLPFPFLLCPGKTEVLLCPLQLPPGTCAGRVQFLDN